MFHKNIDAEIANIIIRINKKYEDAKFDCQMISSISDKERKKEFHTFSMDYHAISIMADAWLHQFCKFIEKDTGLSVTSEDKFVHGIVNIPGTLTFHNPLDEICHKMSALEGRIDADLAKRKAAKKMSPQEIANKLYEERKSISMENSGLKLSSGSIRLWSFQDTDKPIPTCNLDANPNSYRR